MGPCGARQPACLVKATEVFYKFFCEIFMDADESNAGCGAWACRMQGGTGMGMEDLRVSEVKHIMQRQTLCQPSAWPGRQGRTRQCS